MRETRNNDLAIVTVVTRNYAHFAQVLLRSCRRFHPEADLYVLYADPPPETWREQTEGTRVLHAESLAIPDWRRFAFQYTPFELACALKPVAMEHLHSLGYRQIVYLDGDMQLFGPMQEVFDALDRSSIVLTPHLLKPLPIDGKNPHEATFLASGAFNTGFIAVNADAASKAFVLWWKEMNREKCIVDFANALFVDQAWMSLAPGLFEGVHILREPGVNTGHWSLSQFSFTRQLESNRSPSGIGATSGIAVDGKPLTLFHFSGLTPNKLPSHLRCKDRTTIAAHPILMDLVSQYHRDLQAVGSRECESWGCAYATMNDGTPIHPAWREAVRRRHATVSHYQDPFDALTCPELIGRFRDLESGAYQWRRDWRLQWSKTQGILGNARSAGKKIKGLLQGFYARSRAA